MDALPTPTDDDIVESIVVELRRCKLCDPRPLDGRSIHITEYRKERIRWIMSLVRRQPVQIPADVAKKIREIRPHIGGLKKQLPPQIPMPIWEEPPKGMHGENAAAYRCAAEAYDLIELLCTKEPTSAEDRGPFRSITDLLLQAAGIKHDSRNICYAVLRAREPFPRNDPSKPPLAPKIV
jgi:hypothetical protein